MLKHDGVINIAVGRNRKEKTWVNKEMKWSELVEKLSNTIRTHETVEEYKEMPKAEQDDIKDVGGFVGGSLKDGRRKNTHVINRGLITLDADHVKDDLLSKIDEKLNCAYCLYSTHKHTKENPRLRIVIPLKRVVSPDEYQAVSRKVAEDLGLDNFDSTTFEAARLMFWPSTSMDGEYIFKVYDEKWLDPDDILQRYPNWRDTSFWPRHEREEKIIKKETEKQGNPLDKSGIVGAFCRTYSIHDAIEKFLNDIYEPYSTNDRYTYTKGSTSGGLVVYEDGLFSYSHHSTDPASGRLSNAFDLIRIHKFGHLDEDVKEGTPVNKLPSYLAMVEFANKDKLVKETIEKERFELMKRDFEGEEVDPKEMFFNNKRFIPMYLAQWFLEQYRCIVIKDELYIYENGRYILGEEIFKEKATRVLKSEFQTYRINEALNYIKNISDKVSTDEATKTGNYLNLKNGLLNLETFELEPHTPEFKTIIQLPIEYNPNAKCPAIEEYLNIVAKDSIPVIEEMLGYCLTESMKYEVTFLLHGEGGNGKGTLIALIGELFGKENTSNIALQTLTENRFLVAELFGKMVNLYADIPSRAVEDTSLFKMLTSGDTVQAEKKHKAPFNFKNRAKLIFSANELPPSRDNTEGYHRRWIVIPFHTKFNNRKLREKLFEKEEIEGLLLKAISGLKRLRKQDGFTDLQSIREMKEVYRERSDNAYKFLKEYCEEDVNSSVSKQELYDAYRRKCSDWGCFPLSQATFNCKVKIVYPNVYEDRKTGKRKWRKLKLNPYLEEFIGDN